MIKATSGIVLFLLQIAIAQGSMVTFDPPPCLTCESRLTHYEEDGVLITGSYSHYGMDVSGNAVNASTGAVRFSHFSAMSIQLSDGSNFSLNAVDLAEFSDAFQGTQQTVTFTGLKSNNTTVSQDFIIDGLMDGTGSMTDYESFVFSTEFSDLMKVDISSTMFSMDNLKINAVPVPAAMWLFISGLTGLMVFAKRKT